MDNSQISALLNTENTCTLLYKTLLVIVFNHVRDIVTIATVSIHKQIKEVVASSFQEPFSSIGWFNTPTNWSHWQPHGCKNVILRVRCKLGKVLCI